MKEKEQGKLRNLGWPANSIYLVLQLNYGIQRNIRAYTRPELVSCGQKCVTHETTPNNGIRL